MKIWVYQNNLKEILKGMSFWIRKGGGVTDQKAPFIMVHIY